MAGAGRRIKLTDEVMNDIVAALSIGATEQIAAGHAHVSWSSFNVWMKLGRKTEELLQSNPKVELDDRQKLYHKLVKLVEQARAEAGVKWLQVVNSAANKDPQWASWMLSRKFPDAFGTTRQQVVGADGKEVVFRVVYGDPGDDSATDVKAEDDDGSG